MLTKSNTIAMKTNTLLLIHLQKLVGFASQVQSRHACAQHVRISIGFGISISDFEALHAPDAHAELNLDRPVIVFLNLLFESVAALAAIAVNLVYCCLPSAATFIA